jgi:hypothetical protein
MSNFVQNWIHFLVADEDKAWKPAITIKQVRFEAKLYVCEYWPYWNRWLLSFLELRSFLVFKVSSSQRHFDKYVLSWLTCVFHSPSSDLLDSPNAEDPAQAPAYELFRSDKAQYEWVYLISRPSTIEWLSTKTSYCLLRRRVRLQAKEMAGSV